MARDAMSVNDQLIQAEQMAGHWLALENQASEQGKHGLAERHYARAQKWHDKMNRLLGNGEDGVARPSNRQR